MTQKTTFGTALRAFRQREGIGIFDLAARLGWKGTGPVIELEKGRRLPRPSTIDRLGAALRLTPSDIAYLRGLAGYGNITRLPPKEQIIAVLETVAEQVRDYQFPLYITDFRGLYWLINENEITLHGTDYSTLEASMRSYLTVFDAIFDSRLDVRGRLVNCDQIEQEHVFRFKARNAFRRHEPFYDEYPDAMSARLLPEDYAHFRAVWDQVVLELSPNKLLFPFGNMQHGSVDLTISVTDKQVFNFQRVEQQILHVDGLFDLIYYRPVGTGVEQDATYAYFAAHRPILAQLRLWELVDIDAVIAAYNRDVTVEA
ncbi:MAG: helix-turn-helix transcriptional regulator [Chloroflexi bacterium]|uniref:helix-turn-helix domain-containing protein n=1 Tax=Candidatus Flexifilum breve TaxID=3140694 RepID=UPI0031355361|nr:helix-turn-helix transcriptional regulator [Chloroflexota bacterium]